MLASACSPGFWANALTPNRGNDRHTDIAYGALDRQTLDVYVPDDKTAGAPVAVFFYGGSWQSGSKGDYRFVGQALASRGIIAVLPNYRLYPTTRFPGFVEDGAKAVTWAYQHARDYGGDPDRLFVSGHSAGAHIAAMLATDGRYLADAGISTADLAGFIGMAGPFDFLPIRDPALQEIFAPEASWPASQPINFFDGDEPPMLLMHGSEDETVAPKNSRNLAARVNASGGSAELKMYPGIGHIDLIARFITPLRFAGSELDDFAAFVETLAKPKETAALVSKGGE